MILQEKIEQGLKSLGKNKHEVAQSLQALGIVNMKPGNRSEGCLIAQFIRSLAPHNRPTCGRCSASIWPDPADLDSRHMRIDFPEAVENFIVHLDNNYHNIRPLFDGFNLE